ncbi:oligosaccharide flippase family protein [Sphingomonas sp. IC-11]|uniref:oligosaccharide flippase family protein n=1 Tax=Sphingomonas sp. IC-11 TaxID=2898528 RepID=UPI001E49530B|nr:oligosaccharide flippase family protein [Sphingomonas sp. IC-11]MCD2316187.1 oligosaccharide flippase family protein [Sphingomonas sp. IC-11]
MLRSGTIVLVANVVDVAAVLLRNIILARLLPVEQFGLAATFSILMTMIETFQNVGLNRLVVQDSRAEDPHFLASLHGAQIGVSVAAALLLAAFAYPFALAMGTPALTSAYLLLALVPLANAFGNLETFRMQRHGKFGPQVRRALLSQPIGLLAILPGYWWLGDHRAALVSIIAQQWAAVVLTHVHVRPAFRVAFDRMVWQTAAAFGWPLIANGLLMFLILNGDRIIVLHRFGPAALGWFSAAVMLTLTPANLIAKSLQTVTLPPLSRARSNTGAFQRIYDRCCSATALAALASILGALLLGKVIIALLFGEKFMPAAGFLTALACMNALRLLRVAPTIAAMAHGETRNPLYANLVRALGVPLAMAAATLTGAIGPMILAGILAELAGATLAGELAHRRAGIDGARYRQLLLLLTLCLAAALMVTWGSGYGWLLLLPLATLLLGRCAARLDLSAALQVFRATPTSRRG